MWTAQRDTPYRSHTLVDRTEGHTLQVPHILWTAQCYHCLLLYLCSTVSQCFQKPPPRSIQAETHQISLKMSIDISYRTLPSPSHDPHHHPSPSHDPHHHPSPSPVMFPPSSPYSSTSRVPSPSPFTYHVPSMIAFYVDRWHRLTTSFYILPHSDNLPTPEK